MSLLARLIEAGTPADLVAEVAMELARAKVSQEAIETRRAADRERQARRRGNVTSRDTADVTINPALSRPPNENNSNPPTHTHPEKKSRAREAHRMPVDWQPGPLPLELAEAVKAWPPGALERELARFRDWAAGGGPNAKKSNWDAAWRNWIRKAEDDGRYARKQPQTFARPALVDIGRSVAADLEREAQARAGF